MEKEIEEKVRVLKASLDQVKEFIAFQGLSPRIPGFGPSIGLPNQCRRNLEPRVAIGNFYLLYGDLKSLIDRSPEQIRRKWCPRILTLWKEYHALTLLHPEIFSG